MSNAEITHQPGANEIVAANVRAELSRQRWTGRKAANALAVSQPYMARRLNGEVPLSPADLTMLAALLAVPVSRFFDGTDSQEVHQQITMRSLATVIPLKPRTPAHNRGTLATVTPIGQPA